MTKRQALEQMAEAFLADAKATTGDLEFVVKSIGGETCRQFVDALVSCWSPLALTPVTSWQEYEEFRLRQARSAISMWLANSRAPKL